MTDALDDIPLTIIGHPWAPIGMGEQMRSHVAACRAVHLLPAVFDIYRYAQRADPAHDRLLTELECQRVPAGIRIFHINGDEVGEVIRTFIARGNSFEKGYNIIVPAWELPAYPKEWAEHLRRFDEVWALSHHIAESLATAGVRSTWIGQAVESDPGALLPRRHFGIRESAFALLHFFDLTSYASRKNPEAVLDLFARLRATEPFADLQLVLKVKSAESGAAEWAAALPPDPQVRVLSEPLDTLGTRSLIAACDCFVSLHRAEGFGRGLGEAMALGRLALGTAWSGNLDFMDSTNSLLVRNKMVRLKRDEYPHWRGQSWAEADVGHAAELLAPILADPTRGAELARRGRADVLRSHGNRAVGMRILERIEEIVADSVKLGPILSGAATA